MELQAEVLPAVDLEDVVVAAGGAVEGDGRAQGVEPLLDLGLVFAEDGEAAAGELDVGPGAPGAAQADGDVGQDDLAHVLVRHEAVGVDAIGDVAGGAGHARPHAGEHDLGRGILDGAGVEVGVDEGELVVLGDVVGLLAGLEGVPDGLERADVVLHARGGGHPGDAEAALVVALHLAAEAEGEAALAQLLDVPRLHGEHHGHAGEGDGDGGGDLQPLRGVRRERGGEHRVVRRLRHVGEVKTEFLGAPRAVLDVREPAAAESAANLHRSVSFRGPVAGRQRAIVRGRGA